MVYCEKDDTQAETEPPITGAGVGLIVITIDTVESQDDAFVSVKSIEPVPATAHCTLMAFPEFETIIPPDTFHAYEIPAMEGAE